ncbi:hypothetical protein Ssi03_61430 [Sphaerisporangium siamense]|nr:hypothetical protein Ssi03_61430 [Sphaerisporangium siamense]
MKVRRFQAVAVLAMALGADLLAGAGPAAAVVVTGHAATSVQARGLLPPDWYRSSYYPTMEACRVGLADAAANGQYTGLSACYYYAGDRNYRAGYYFNIYIP